MKKKFLLSVFVILLVLILIGCSRITPVTDEVAEVEDVIQNYSSAMNNQDWDKAKSYCIYQSWAYFMVDTIESFADYYEVFTYKIDRIEDIEIEGNYGEANIHIVSTLGVWWEYIYLQKVSGVWKIYTSYAYF